MIARRTPSRQIRFNATNESLWISYQIGFPLCVDSTKRKLRPDFGARCSKLSKERGPETGSRLDRIRYRRYDGDVFMRAFLIELDGDDLRRDPLAVRKATLGSLLRRAAPGIRFNEHLDEEDGPLVFEHACKLGLEGIVSKRRDSIYSSGRSLHWVKSKNPNAPAVRRELEEDWSGRRGYGQKNKARQHNASAFPS